MSTILAPHGVNGLVSPVTPQQFNLLNAARANREPGERWYGGVAFLPEIHGVVNAVTVDQCAPGTAVGDLLDGLEPNGQGEAAAFGMVMADRCSTIGGDPDELTARLVRAIDAQTSHFVERWLWTGKLHEGGTAGPSFNTVGSHSNRFLTTAADLIDPTSGTPVGVVSAMSTMLEAIAEHAGGERMMIHVPARLLPFLQFYGQFRVSGATLLTPGDHILVPGTGYTGSAPGDVAPAADVSWMYATPIMEARVSSIAPDVTYDTDVNDIIVTASRVAVVLFDPAPHIGVPVGHPDPGPALS